MIDWRRNQIAIPIILMVINVLLYEVGWKAIMYYSHSYPGADGSDIIFMLLSGILFAVIPSVAFFYIIFHIFFYKGFILKRIVMGVLPFTFFVVYSLGYILNNSTEYIDTVRLNKFNQNYAEYQEIVNYAYDTVNQKPYVVFPKGEVSTVYYQGKINPKIARQIFFCKETDEGKVFTYIFFIGHGRLPGIRGGVYYASDDKLFNAYMETRKEKYSGYITLEKIKPHWYFVTYS